MSMLRSLKLQSSILTRRSFLTSTTSRAEKSKGGFGEEERQKAGAAPVKDSAPYQNEYTKSGTNSEVAHNDESYSSNTNPEESNARQGESLDSSPANKDASRSADPATSNKTEREPSDASGFSKGGNSGNRSGNAKATQADVSKTKFDKLSKKNDDMQTVGGRSVTT